MKLRIKNCITFLLVFTLFSCGCKQLFFDKNETFWVDSYNKGDIAVFQSNKDSLLKDTIFILEKHSYKPTGECNPMVSMVDPEGYVIDYKYSHRGVVIDTNYLVQHFKDEVLSRPIIRIYDVEFSGSTLKDTTVTLKKYGTLKDCYTFRKFQSFNNLEDFKIKCFVWSKKLGLVLIINSKEEKYELVKKGKLTSS